MNKDNEIKKYIDKKPQNIIKEQYMPKLSGNLTSLIGTSLSDDLQYGIFIDDKGQSYYGRNVIYRDKNTKANIVYKETDDISYTPENIIQDFETLIKDKILTAPDINLFTKKLFHFIHICAFKQWHKKGYNKSNIGDILAKDLIIEISKKDIEEYFNISKQYFYNNITTALYALSKIEILEFITKRRDKGRVIVAGNDIRKIFTNFNAMDLQAPNISISLEYAKYLFNYGYIQYPSILFQCNNQVAFDIVEFLYRQYFLDDKKNNNLKISVEAILQNITSIPSFEKVSSKYNRKYKQRIYDPFENSILYINDFFSEVLEIEPIYTLEEKQNQNNHIYNKKTNKEDWQNRKLKVTFKDAPNYGTKQKQNRKKAQKKAEAE